jgi:diguanylate cyclase (GGDEF)-like protein
MPETVSPKDASESTATAAAERTPQEIERTLARHAREHEALARLSQIALREYQLRTLIEEIVATVMRTLDLELCGVSRLRADEETLDVIVSAGQAHTPPTVPVKQGSQAGYAVRTRQPVVSDDLLSETRFHAPGLLGMGMRSGVSAIIEGHERPFGILSAHSRRPRRFTTDDVNFLIAVANVLSAAVERNRKEEAARHAALHDPLTGLPNRTLAIDRLDLALARRRRAGTSTVALLLIDLDRFTMVNESLGHGAGDEVLLALAGRLRQTLRVSDTAARMSADEFAVICESEGGVHDVVELAQRIGVEFGRPLPLDGGERVFTASIGIAVAESLKDSASSMLRDADAAMYRAKRRGPGSYELFDSAVRAQVLTRLRTEAELRHAIGEDQLCLHYQPILELPSGRPIATEALVRWQHPQHGLIPPLDFIPVAEETGLIAELGRYVLKRASEQCIAWQRQFDEPLRMFVNVSGMQIVNPAFVEEVADIAGANGLAPGTLGLEVTESVLVEAEGSAITVLSQLHDHGLRLMLDDFGTGYSSLGYLRSFPLDGVKIDRSFIDGLIDNREDAAIIRAIIDMCSALGLATVAEGVECEDQLNQLSELGCEYVQGYLLCHPMAAPEIGEFLTRHLLAVPSENGGGAASGERPRNLGRFAA